MARGYMISGLLAAAIITIAIIYITLPSGITDLIFTIPGQCDKFVHIPTLGRIYITQQVLGAGAFSLVLVGRAIDAYPEIDVAVKIGMSERAGIAEDTKVLTALNGTVNFPNYYGTTHVRCQRGDRVYTHPVLVMELLGNSVDTLARNAATSVTSYRVRKALEIGRGVLDGVQILHQTLGLMMHDIYARNIVFSKDDNQLVPKLIDFGECLRIEKHGARDYHSLNRLYTSIREDQREPLGPRDDLERIVYLMIHVAHGGQMPWFSEDGEWITSKKASMNANDVCSFLPKEVAQILVYARSGIVDAADLPNYDYVRELINTAISGIPDSLPDKVMNSSDVV